LSNSSFSNRPPLPSSSHLPLEHLLSRLPATELSWLFFLFWWLVFCLSRFSRSAYPPRSPSSFPKIPSVFLNPNLPGNTGACSFLPAPEGGPYDRCVLDRSGPGLSLFRDFFRPSFGRPQVFLYGPPALFYLSLCLGSYASSARVPVSAEFFSRPDQPSARRSFLHPSSPVYSRGCLGKSFVVSHLTT